MENALKKLYIQLIFNGLVKWDILILNTFINKKCVFLSIFKPILGGDYDVKKNFKIDYLEILTLINLFYEDK